MSSKSNNSLRSIFKQTKQANSSSTKPQAHTLIFPNKLCTLQNGCVRCLLCESNIHNAFTGDSKSLNAIWNSHIAQPLHLNKLKLAQEALKRKNQINKNNNNNTLTTQSTVHQLHGNKQIVRKDLDNNDNIHHSQDQHEDQGEDEGNEIQAEGEGLALVSYDSDDDDDHNKGGDLPNEEKEKAEEIQLTDLPSELFDSIEFTEEELIQAGLVPSKQDEESSFKKNPPALNDNQNEHGHDEKTVSNVQSSSNESIPNDLPPGFFDSDPSSIQKEVKPIKESQPPIQSEELSLAMIAFNESLAQREELAKRNEREMSRRVKISILKSDWDAEETKIDENSIRSKVNQIKNKVALQKQDPRPLRPDNKRNLNAANHNNQPQPHSHDDKDKDNPLSDDDLDDLLDWRVKKKVKS